MVMAERSLPAPGSVMQIVPSISPWIAGTRKRRHSSSLPDRKMKYVPMRDCIMHGAARARQPPESSSRASKWDMVDVFVPPYSSG